MRRPTLSEGRKGNHARKVEKGCVNAEKHEKSQYLTSFEVVVIKLRRAEEKGGGGP